MIFFLLLGQNLKASNSNSPDKNSLSAKLFPRHQARKRQTVSFIAVQTASRKCSLEPFNKMTYLRFFIAGAKQQKQRKVPSRHPEKSYSSSKVTMRQTLTRTVLTAGSADVLCVDFSAGERSGSTDE